MEGPVFKVVCLPLNLISGEFLRKHSSAVCGQGHVPADKKLPGMDDLDALALVLSHTISFSESASEVEVEVEAEVEVVIARLPRPLQEPFHRTRCLGQLKQKALPRPNLEIDASGT